MTIYREGKPIYLTHAELVEAWNIIRNENLKSDIRDRIDLFMDDISFKSFAEHDCESEDEFYTRIVDECFELANDFLDRCYSYEGAINDAVDETLNDFNLWEE